MEEINRQPLKRIIKIALVGPESTGKTTLAQQLAQHYNTAWTAEFARQYLQEKWNNRQQTCTLKDLVPIAQGQLQLETQVVKRATGYLFCDTTALVTQVFSEINYGQCDPVIAQMAKEQQYDFFFLTATDVPFEKDDLRDPTVNREASFLAFENALKTNKSPFITLFGTENERLNTAIFCLENLEKAKKMGFSVADFVQIYHSKIPLESIEMQLHFFQKGIPKTVLVRAATLNDGILKLSMADFEEKEQLFQNEKEQFRLQKFVPASGAATRMFQFLNTFLNEFDSEKETINAYINRTKSGELLVFIVGMEKFPFFAEVYQKLKEVYVNFDTLDRDYKNYYFIKMLLDPAFFDFSNKPKGVLPFHKYITNIATPIQEHLYECAYYSSSNNQSKLHFTVTEGHQSFFEHYVALAKEKVERETKTKITIAYSYQNKATDSIAVDANNVPIRDANNRLIFRPSGHGALIENLNHLDADIVFIKNIDNVVHNRLQTNSFYKKALAGILIDVQRQLFSCLKTLDEPDLEEEKVSEIARFLEQKLNILPVSNFEKWTLENKITILKTSINKPIRVCGMVKNEGEPGGGPFWVQNKNGGASLQIVESAQVDGSNKSQQKILERATHFNPVDLVCGIKNYKNQKFDLLQFVDPETGFIVQKSKGGKEVKGYELPGLWNGAMTQWITIFVEVPLITFNPVKTVNDLLKSPHQPQ